MNPSAPMSASLPLLHQMLTQHLALDSDAIDDGAPFVALGLDSLSLVDFMFAVEDRFDVDIDHQQVMADPTLQGLARLVDRLRAPQLLSLRC